MQTFDILVLVIILITMAVGARKGFVWQAATIISLIGSAIVAMRFSEVLAPMFNLTEPWNQAVAALILFLVTSLVINLLFGFVESLIVEWKLKNFDRTAGAILGIIKGVLWATLLTFFIIMLGGPKGADFVLKSTSGAKLISVIQEIDAILPDKLQEALSGHIEQFEQNLREPEGESVDVEAVWRHMVAARNLSDLIPATELIGGDSIPIPQLGPVETDVPNSRFTDPKIKIGAGGQTDSLLAETDDNSPPSDDQIEEEIDRGALRHQLMGHAMQLTIAGARLALPRGRSLKNKTGKSLLFETTTSKTTKTQTLVKKGLQSPLTEHKIHYRTLSIGADLAKDTDRTSSPATKLYQKMLSGEIEMPTQNTTSPGSETVASSESNEDTEAIENRITDDTETTSDKTIENANNITVAIDQSEPTEDEATTSPDENESTDDQDQQTADSSPSDNPPATDEKPADNDDPVTEDKPNVDKPANEESTPKNEVEPTPDEPTEESDPNEEMTDEPIDESNDESSDPLLLEETMLVDHSPW